MPFANEHACRLHDPGDYVRFRRQNGIGDVDGKRLDAIIGFKSGGGSEVQSFRYPTSEGWVAGAARSHCSSHHGNFEAATGKESMENVLLLDQAYREKDLEALRAKESPIIYDASGYALKWDAGQPMQFVANEETPNRWGDVIVASGWQLENFRKNPVLMFSHDHDLAPVGSVPHVEVRGKQLLATVKWDDEDPFAAYVKGKYERGFMRAVSVGFQPLEWQEQDADKSGRRPIRFDKSELLELSVVAVPAHPGALRQGLGDRRFRIIVPQVIDLDDDVDLEIGIQELSSFDVTTLRSAIKALRSTMEKLREE